MSLRTYTPRRELVPLNDDPLYVRGLSVTDVSKVVGNHLKDVEDLVQSYERKGFNIFAPGAESDLIRNLVADAPQLVGLVIALACDDEDCAEIAAALPLAVQVDALAKIITLTFQDAGGPKAFFETLRRLGPNLAAVKKAGKKKG